MIFTQQQHGKKPRKAECVEQKYQTEKNAFEVSDNCNFCGSAATALVVISFDRFLLHENSHTKYVTMTCQCTGKIFL